MKKVIIAAAFAFAATGANAQDITFRSSDNATTNLSIMLPNWIDLAPEGALIEKNVVTDGSNWVTALNNGFKIGDKTYTVSATRKFEITAVASDLTRGGGGAGHHINNSRISLKCHTSTGGINPGTWAVVAPFGNELLASNSMTYSPVTMATNTTGCHQTTFNVELFLYKNSPTGTYYADNIIGDASVPFTGTMSMVAQLVNP